ncbi:MAG TPA: OmpH family outer membrane protein [Pyrinomonadaceae bacterium]|nr:OmpH family outer membrane protein [Pyrinomonadaceae bacterium]
MRVVGAALLLTVMAASLALPRGGASPSASRAEGGQDVRAATTRLAVFDGEYLAQKGVNPKANSTLAALAAFGSAAGLQLFDVARIQGKVLIADGGVDISDAFIKALKSKPTGAEGLSVKGVNVPAAAAALVDTETFGDPRKGVTNLVNAFSKVEQEFRPRKEEIEKLRDELKTAPEDRRQELEAEVARKQKAGQAALDKRVKALTDPVYEDIGRALLAFCKKHGIALVFDLSKMERDETLPPFDLPLPADAPDVTEAFVAAYNRGDLKR